MTFNCHICECGGSAHCPNCNTDEEILEARALQYTCQGYQPVDGEPGEWITLAHTDGRVITLNTEES